MKRDLKSMRRELPNNKDEAQKILSQADPRTVNSIQQTIDAYAGKSETELMGELRRMTDAQLRSGSLTPNGMDAMVAKLAPMLTPEQQRRMQQVLRQLKGL